MTRNSKIAYTILGLVTVVGIGYWFLGRSKKNKVDSSETYGAEAKMNREIELINLTF